MSACTSGWHLASPADIAANGATLGPGAGARLEIKDTGSSMEHGEVGLRQQKKGAP